MAGPPKGFDSRSRAPESGIPSEQSKIGARLEDSLAMSKVGSRQSRGIPDGRHRAAGLYRMRPVSPTTSTLLYENASGLRLTPSKGAQVLTWTTR